MIRFRTVLDFIYVCDIREYLQKQTEYAINRLISDKWETIRYGDCYCIGLADAATGNLLHLVQHVSNHFLLL